jgi:hypothetical protein
LGGLSQLVDLLTHLLLVLCILASHVALNCGSVCAVATTTASTMVARALIGRPAGRGAAAGNDGAWRISPGM